MFQISSMPCLAMRNSAGNDKARTKKNAISVMAVSASVFIILHDALPMGLLNRTVREGTKAQSRFSEALSRIPTTDYRGSQGSYA